MTRKSSYLTIYLFTAAILLTLVSAKPTSSQSPKAQDQKAALIQNTSSTNHLVVHEWGTFTSIAGGDGHPVQWQPLSGPGDLPSFVYDMGSVNSGRGLRHGQQCYKCEDALIRMETPVIYFYADHEMTLSANVGMSRGTITEWYPQARGAYKGEPEKGFSSDVSWGNITVLPTAAESLPVESKKSHYYAARDTDAALIRVCGKQEQQYEKFLFYRGIGNFDLPLAVKLEGDRLDITNEGSDPVATCVVFENRGGKMGYRIGKFSDKNLMIERPALDQTQAAVERDLVTLLTCEGLYEKEARAMVATWRDSWFEDGLRVFYVMPRALTDRTLPLSLEPRPTELVRVLVGRTEVITPEMEQAIQKQLAPLNDPSADVRSVAMEVIRTHGRFAEPILREMLKNTSDKQRQDLINEIIRSAHSSID